MYEDYCGGGKVGSANRRADVSYELRSEVMPLAEKRGGVMLIEQRITENGIETVDKVGIAVARLREFEPPEGYYLAFSGGKDSVVIYDLAVKAGVKFDAHYSVTGVDPPELVRFIKQQYPDVKRHIQSSELFKINQEDFCIRL